jgi:starch-binding outer membrane protein, SusD/RagB family
MYYGHTGMNEIRELYNRRHKGEAHALRALFMYYLLKHHAGEGPDGTLLGVPIYTEPFDTDTDFRNKPRNTFAECVQQIYTDLEEAAKYLPLDYGNVQSANVTYRQCTVNILWKVTIEFLVI